MFHEAFTPHLYARYTLRAKQLELDSQSDNGTPQRISNSDDMSYVKDFAVDTRFASVEFETDSAAQSEGARAHGEICNRVSDRVKMALECMPNIAAF